MTRCVHCDEPIDPLEQAHAAHEPDCPVDIDAEDWACRCDAYAHRRCCRSRSCAPTVEVAPVVPLSRKPQPVRLTG